MGEHEFVSIPDATVEARTKVNFVGPTFVVAEDKSDPDPLEPNQDTNFDGSEIKGFNKKEYEKKWKTESAKARIESKTAKSEGSPTNTKSYQLAGEMLAAATRNFAVYQMPQTIFGLRVIGVYFFSFLTLSHSYEGTRMTLHRADFPVSYLESVKKGIPTGNITILR